MDERAFFDRLAPTWDDNEILSTPAKINEILDCIGLAPGMRVLDLGTGTGVLLPYIAQRIGTGGSIAAVDYSEGMLSRARSKFSDLLPTPEFLRIDFETENIPGVYDRILLYSVYPHLHTPLETLRWLRAVNLADGGIITVAFPSGPDFINSIHREKHSDSDVLPPASVLASELRACGLDASVAREDPTTYVINITSRQPR